MSNLQPGAAVRYFHKLMGQPAPDVPEDGIMQTHRWTLRRNLIDEEYKELKDAWSDGDHAAFLDACVDLVYVVVGTAVEAGLPFDDAFDLVHRANMEKAAPCVTCSARGWVSRHPAEGEVERITCPTCEGECRVVRYNVAGKVLKPVGWVAPDIAALIGRDTDAARATPA